MFLANDKINISPIAVQTGELIIFHKFIKMNLIKFVTFHQTLIRVNNEVQIKGFCDDFKNPQLTVSSKPPFVARSTLAGIRVS